MNYSRLSKTSLQKPPWKAVPTYRELALERLKTLRPKLQEMIAKEAKSLADRMPTMLQEKANESLQRVTDKVAADVKKEIPGLTPETSKDFLILPSRDGD